MLALWTKVTTWMKDEKGASMVEYALLVVLIAIVALVAIRIAGQEVNSTFSEIASGLAGAKPTIHYLVERDPLDGSLSCWPGKARHGRRIK